MNQIFFTVLILISLASIVRARYRAGWQRAAQ